MGSLGMLGQSLVQVPGMEGVPKSVNAIFVGNGMVGGVAVFALIGVLESTVFVQDESKEPGNFGNPLPWWEDYSDEMRARELNNGRIAMFAHRPDRCWPLHWQGCVAAVRALIQTLPIDYRFVTCAGRPLACCYSPRPTRLGTDFRYIAS